MARKLPAPLQLTPLEQLLQPLDLPYTDALAIERHHLRAELYAQASASDTKAEILCELSRRSFWAHLALFVYTHDENAVKLRIKPFSPLAMYKRMADFFDERHPDGTWKHPLNAIPKSRQLMVSWIVMAREDWCCLHNQNSYCFVISENRPKAADQIKRLRTIHQKYPPWFLEYCGQQRARPLKDGFVYQNASIIESIEQRSGRGVASYVVTMGFSDEAAHQMFFERNWTALRPACKPSTQIFLASSANPSYFFTNIVRDRMDGKQGGKATVYFDCIGMSAWRNRLNGLDVLRVHYTADPARRTREWKTAAMKGVAGMHQWRQEQEIDDTARGGRPIFQRYLDRTVHVTAGHVEVYPQPRRGRKPGWMIKVTGWDQPRSVLALMRAIDHGTSGYCAAVWVAVDEDLDWFVFRTYKKTGFVAPMNAAAICKLSYRPELQDYENYERDEIDAMQGLPDRRGKVEDVYRDFTDAAGRRPLRRIEAVSKGAGSRQEGLDMIASMLLSTLAVNNPEGECWTEITQEWRDLMGEPELDALELKENFAQYSSLYLARDMAEDLWDELDAARWDEPSNKDPDADRPETSSDMMDDLIDCLRYLIRAGSGKYLRQNKNVRIS